MRAVLIATFLSLAAAGPALAYCYEDIGCDDTDRFSGRDLRQLSCQALYEVRNGIYFQNGYCFKTERALDLFGDDECYVEDMEDVRLNANERNNAALIISVEKQKGCD